MRERRTSTAVDQLGRDAQGLHDQPTSWCMIELGAAQVREEEGETEDRQGSSRPSGPPGELETKTKMEHPPYSLVKAIGAIASHQMWTIGDIALPHTSHNGGPTGT